MDQPRYFLRSMRKKKTDHKIEHIGHGIAETETTPNHYPIFLETTTCDRVKSLRNYVEKKRLMAQQSSSTKVKDRRALRKVKRCATKPITFATCKETHSPSTNSTIYSIQTTNVNVGPNTVSTNYKSMSPCITMTPICINRPGTPHPKLHNPVTPRRDKDGFVVPEIPTQEKLRCPNTPILPEHIYNLLNSFPWTPRTNTALGSSHQKTPVKVQEPHGLPQTPGSSFSIPITPQIMKLFSSSPSVLPLHLGSFSTPTLFQGGIDKGVPDILQMIEDENKTVSLLERKMATFDTASLSDGTVADYIMEITDDYTTIVPVLPKAKQTIITKAPELIAFQKGSYGKKMTVELESAVREENKKKQKEKRIENKKRKKTSVSEGGPENIKRKVQRCGRRTRSLVKACKDMGLAKNDKEVDEMFRKSRRDREDEE